MKNLVSLCLLAVTVFSLVSCEKKKTEPATNNPGNNQNPKGDPEPELYFRAEIHGQQVAYDEVEQGHGMANAYTTNSSCGSGNVFARIGSYFGIGVFGQEDFYISFSKCRSKSYDQLRQDCAAAIDWLAEESAYPVLGEEMPFGAFVRIKDPATGRLYANRSSTSSGTVTITEVAAYGTGTNGTFKYRITGTINAVLQDENGNSLTVNDGRFRIVAGICPE